MPNSPTIVGDNTVLWGTSGVYSGTGIVVSGSKALGSEKLEVADEDGFTVAVIYFNHKHQCDFEMIVKTAAPALDIGDFITLCAVVDCVVENVTEVWTQKDNRRLRVTAIKYEAIDAPAP